MSKYVLQRYVLRNIFPIIGKTFGKMIRILPKNVASLIFVGRNLLSLTFFISVKVDRETLLICSRRKQTMSLKNCNHINYNWKYEIGNKVLIFVSVLKLKHKA